MDLYGPALPTDNSNNANTPIFRPSTSATHLTDTICMYITQNGLKTVIREIYDLIVVDGKGNVIILAKFMIEVTVIIVLIVQQDNSQLEKSDSLKTNVQTSILYDILRGNPESIVNRYVSIRPLPLSLL